MSDSDIDELGALAMELRWFSARFAALFRPPGRSVTRQGCDPLSNRVIPAARTSWGQGGKCREEARKELTGLRWQVERFLAGTDLAARIVNVLDTVDSALQKDRLPTGRIEDLSGRLNHFASEVERCKVEPKGVTLHDAAFILTSNEKDAGKLVRKWIGTNRLKQLGIGNCPKDGRRRLYKLDDVVAVVSGSQQVTPEGENAFRKELISRLRSPRVSK